MTIGALALALLAGVAAGTVAGLLGIGGGVLMVPLLYFMLSQPALTGVLLEPQVQTLVAHATSLAVVVPTAWTGLAVHHRRRLVEWRAALPMLIVAMACALVATRVAVRLSPELLRSVFGLVLLAAGGRLLVAGGGAALGERAPRLAWPLAASCGFVVGLVSGLLGIGGGIVAIPMLVYIVRLDLTRVTGTSLAVVSFTALAALIGYSTVAIEGSDLPGGLIGYVFLPAALTLGAGALMGVRLGALAHRRVSGRWLRGLFSALLLLVGVRLLLVNVPRLLG